MFTIRKAGSITSKLLLLYGLLLATPTTGNAADLTIRPLSAKLSCNISYSRSTGWTFMADPLNLEAFQLDVTFDPTRAQFTGLSYVSPYVQSSPPDLSMLQFGLLQDVAGFASPPHLVMWTSLASHSWTCGQTYHLNRQFLRCSRAAMTFLPF